MKHEQVVMYSIVLTKERLEELVAMGCVFGSSTAYKTKEIDMRVCVDYI